MNHSKVRDTVTSQSSLNPFKRTNRLSDETEYKEKKPSPFSGRFWLRRQSSSARLDPMSNLNQIDAPPPFVPPGVQRVPTPPIFDANGEVKGKLANFFFDIHGPSDGRKKPKQSPGGVWDSDALLMSLSSDLDLSDDEEDEEGPEGPLITPSAVAL